MKTVCEPNSHHVLASRAAVEVQMIDLCRLQLYSDDFATGKIERDGWSRPSRRPEVVVLLCLNMYNNVLSLEK